MVEESTTKTKRQNKTILENIQENQSSATPHPVGKIQSRIQNSSPKEQERRQGKICQLSQQQYIYKHSLEQSETTQRQRSRKNTILEVNGAQ